MRNSVILILLLTITTFGQQRNSSTDVPLPAAGAAGTVTLSLSEYNRLVELSARKTQSPDTAPLPFVLTRAVSSCVSKIKRFRALSRSTALHSRKDQ